MFLFIIVAAMVYSTTAFFTGKEFSNSMLLWWWLILLMCSYFLNSIINQLIFSYISTASLQHHLFLMLDFCESDILVSLQKDYMLYLIKLCKILNKPHYETILQVSPLLWTTYEETQHTVNNCPLWSQGNLTCEIFIIFRSLKRHSTNMD
jgi:hypothetical protein